jgi:hypothetical protein
MEPLGKTNLACAVAAAAAHGFNNELTIILSSVSDALDLQVQQHPAGEMLLEIQAAAQRCVWISYGLLNFSARVNSAPIRASFEYLIDL